MRENMMYYLQKQSSQNKTEGGRFLEKLLARRNYPEAAKTGALQKSFS